MPLYLDNAQPLAFYFGTQAISKIYLGAGIVWGGSVTLAKLAAVGDSTVAAYAGGDPVAGFVTGADPTTLAVPGHTIDQQLAVWNAQTAQAKLAYDVVVIQIGLNDVANVSSSASAVSTATAAIARYQNLFDVIRGSTKAGCKIAVSKMLPCRQRWIDLFGATNGIFGQQQWIAINEAVAGNGSNPISGVDGRIVSHVPLLDDGNGNLANAYNTGDNIHENNAGRQIIAQAWRSVLVAIGAIT